MADSCHDYYGQNPYVVGMRWVTMMMKMVTVMIIHLEDEHTDDHYDDEEEKEESDGDADDFSRLELFAVVNLA